MIAKEQAIYIANLFYRAAPAAALFCHFLSMTQPPMNVQPTEDRYYWELSHRIFACKIIMRYGGGTFAFPGRQEQQQRNDTMAKK